MMRKNSITAGALVVWALGLFLGWTWFGCTCDPVYPEDADLDAAPDAPPDGDGDGDSDADADSDGDADADLDADADGSADADADAPDPYGPCPCPGDEECLTADCPTCALPCMSLVDCPEAPGGTAMPECMPMGGGEMRCLLLCGAGATCPDGMVCDMDFSPVAACMTDC